MQNIGGSLRDFRSRLPIRERAVLGLPLQKVSSERRASPLHLRVLRLRTGTHVGVAVLFKSRFLPGESKDYAQVERFVETFPRKWEVTGW